MGHRNFFCRFVFLALFMRFCVSEEIKSPASTVIKGAFILPVKDVILHNSIFPVEVIIDLPKIALASSPRKCAAKKHLCALVQHALDVQNLLASEVYNNNPYVKGHIIDDSLLQRSGRGLLNFMGEIQRFMWGTATEGQVDQLHVAVGQLAYKFDHYANETNKYIAGLAENVTLYSRRLSSAVETGFNRVEQEISNNTQEVNMAELVFSDVSNILLLNSHIESVAGAINLIALDCRNQLIPRSALTDRFLAAKLQNVSKVIDGHDYEVAATVNQLLKLKVANCHFGTSQMKVTIGVPIRRRWATMKLFKLVHVPFGFEDNECSLSESPSYLVQINDTVIPITDDSSSMCSPKLERRCLVPESVYQPSPFSECAMALLGSRQRDIVDKCVLKCRRSQTVRVQALSSKQFHITNSNNITLRCHDRPDEKYILQESVGAALINLNCFCQAVIFDRFNKITRLVKPSWPCGVFGDRGQASVIHVLPPQMSSLKTAVFEENSFLYQNVTDIYNKKWQLQIPTLTLEDPMPVQFTSTFIARQLEDTVSYSTTVLYVWLSVISVAVFAIIIAMFVSSQSGKTRGGFSPVPFILILLPGGLLAGDEDDKPVTLKASLWAVLEALEIMNVVTGAVIFIFVVFVLTVLGKTLKNIRLVARMLRAWDSGEEMLLRRNY